MRTRSTASLDTSRVWMTTGRCDRCMTVSTRATPRNFLRLWHDPHATGLYLGAPHRSVRVAGQPTEVSRWHSLPEQRVRRAANAVKHSGRGSAVTVRQFLGRGARPGGVRGYAEMTVPRCPVRTAGFGR